MQLSHLIGALCAVVCTVVSISTHAALISRLGGQVVFDNDLGVTWVADAKRECEAPRSSPFT
jgi:hypothetical protein